ncbi:MAG: ABC transporter substrate-binding protein [Streptosporangiales bacterium]|nr:ABC transporter substrate-binding protein [Streptosporangiales bacterium]
MRPTLRTPVVAALLGALVLSGCDAGSTGDKAGPKSSGGGFPATVQAANGKITIDERPERIVSLTPTGTEMLYAIGAGKQVIAVDDQSDFPKQAPRTKLSGFKPNVEAIAGQSPDLVVLADDADGIVASLTKLKVPVVQVPAATRLDETYDQLGDLGTATGHTAEADKVARDLRAELTKIVNETKKPAKPLTYYHELDNSLYSATSKTFVGQVYGMFGLTNIADKAKKQVGDYPQLSSEYVLESDPDMIFLADTKCCGQDAKTVAERPSWDELKAVKNGDVVELDDDIASRWGPRVADFARAVSAAVNKAAAGR